MLGSICNPAFKATDAHMCAQKPDKVRYVATYTLDEFRGYITHVVVGCWWQPPPTSAHTVELG